MAIGTRILRSNFLIKLKSWEYWPFGIVQAPLIMYWLWLSLKARSLFFFSASNPGILNGGMFGESKFSVLKKIPEGYTPKSTLVVQPQTEDEVILKINRNRFSYPLIFKPDLGERGWMVEKIKSEESARNYIRSAKWDFLIQDYVDLPLEFSVFYARDPLNSKGRVTSVTQKEMLKVKGDGVSTLQQLILSKDRAKLQWNILKNVYANQLNNIPKIGTEIELVSIGNHCLGTTFINKNNLITDKLSDSFDSISKQVDGFYFGRYDLRTSSYQDLEDGKIQIMELNGCGAEPSHIYHPGASLLKAFKDLFIHWHTIYAISKANHKMGIPYLSMKDGRALYNKFKAVTSS